uniref:Uncharacterized protein n=1 Tax=Arundo donax TaxID=35708 RepID=A0A0A9DB92_ARUDO
MYKGILPAAGHFSKRTTGVATLLATSPAARGDEQEQGKSTSRWTDGSTRPRKQREARVVCLASWVSRASSEVYDGLADGEVPLHRPRQVEELRRDELEDLVHVDVVRRAREEEGRLHRSCVCSGLQNHTHPYIRKHMKL